MRLTAALVLAPLGCVLAVTPAAGQAAGSGIASVRPGVEVFMQNPPREVKGKKVGLITNHSGMDRQRNSTIDLLVKSGHIQLVALFSPEHGIRGVAESRVDSGRDAKTGLPIHSLYGATYRPTREMLEGIEALIYDIEDLGVRQYTYESTMTLAMEAAAEKGIPIVVLDRPNPVTGRILEGNILEEPFKSFVGIYPVLSRHGLTLGELARMYNKQQNINAQLIVVPMEGWTRGLWRDQTDLPWINPSPNIRSLEAAIHYPGTVFFEAINVSEGRGTDKPFEQIGAPWLDNVELVRRMKAMNLPGIDFEARDIPVSAEATRRKYAGETLKGVYLKITDRETYRPLSTSLLMIQEIARMHPDRFQWRGGNNREPTMLTIERHGGTKALKEAIDNNTLRDLLKKWQADQKVFEQMRAQYLLYQ